MTYRRLDCKGQVKLYNSFKKHGVENHQFDIIEYCYEEELNCSERFWQDQFDVIGENGLNCNLTKSGDRSGEWSEESKDKIRGSNNHFFGKTHTEEVKNMLKSRSGKLSNWYGKKHTEETIKKIKATRVDMTFEKSPRAIKIISLYFNMEFDCITCAAHELGIGKSSMIFYMSGKGETNRFLFMYKTDFEKYKNNIKIINGKVEILQGILSDNEFNEMVEFLTSIKIINFTFNGRIPVNGNI